MGESRATAEQSTVSQATLRTIAVVFRSTTASSGISLTLPSTDHSPILGLVLDFDQLTLTYDLGFTGCAIWLVWSSLINLTGVKEGPQ